MCVCVMCTRARVCVHMRESERARERLSVGESEAHAPFVYHVCTMLIPPIYGITARHIPSGVPSAHGAGGSL